MKTMKQFWAILLASLLCAVLAGTNAEGVNTGEDGLIVQHVDDAVPETETGLGDDDSALRDAWGGAQSSFLTLKDGEGEGEQAVGAPEYIPDDDAEALESPDGGESVISAPESDSDKNAAMWDEQAKGGEQAVMAAGDWEASYESFILGKEYLYTPPFEEYFEDIERDIDWDEPEFGLYDMDRDGISELLVFNGGSYNAIMSTDAFTYRNGEVVYLGRFDGVDCDLFYNENESFPGVFNGAAGYGMSWLDYCFISNGSFKTESIVRWENDNILILTEKNLFLKLLKSGIKGREIPMVPYSKIVKMGWPDFYEYTQNANNQSVVVYSSGNGSPVLNATKRTLTEGDKFTLEVMMMDDGSSVPKLTWSSSKPKVASVDKSGKVTAKAVGTATITVKTKNGKKATCTVTVKKAPGKVTLNKTKATLTAGKTLTLKASIPSGTYTSKYTWSSSNKNVATVDAKGVVTGKKKGSATITVKTANGKTAKCKVTVKAAEKSIELSGYFRQNLSETVRKLGLKKSNDPMYYLYCNDEIGIDDFVWNGEGKVDDISIIKGTNYSLLGVKIGMTAKQVNQIMGKYQLEGGIYFDGEKYKYGNDYVEFAGFLLGSNSWLRISFNRKTNTVMTIDLGDYMV